MSRSATQAIVTNRAFEITRQIVIVVSASLFVALCARVTIPLPFTPVPLTLQNFGVLLVGLSLGSRRGFAALALYLIEGASGMPVFNPAGPGGTRAIDRAYRWLPAGLSVCRRACRMDHGARQHRPSFALSARACSRNCCSSPAVCPGWRFLPIPFPPPFASVFIGLCSLKSSRSCSRPRSRRDGKRDFKVQA